MIQSLMLCGIGLLSGCLLMLFFFPLVHHRAVRLTTRNLVDATPMTINEIQADKDRLRAQFALSLRRLEINLDEMRAKAAGRYGEIGRQSREIGRLRRELDKKTDTIFALRAREHIRKGVVRKTVKILLYLFDRANRPTERVLDLRPPRPQLVSSRT
jgi:hypothetical protein